MRSPKYTVLIANRQTGAVRRLTIVRRPAVLVLGAALAVPMLIGLVGLGARAARQAEVDQLAQQAEVLRIENDSYRAATGELATQISTLQSAISELGQDAQLDPAARRAIENLPSLVKNRAMGQGGWRRVVSDAGCFAELTGQHVWHPAGAAWLARSAP